MAVPYKFTTAASTNLQAVRAGQTGNVTGIAVANVATAIFIKLYWAAPTAGVTVGTTVPNITLGVAASANIFGPLAFSSVSGRDELFVAVTGAAADSDSSNAAAGAIVTLFVE